MSPLTVPLKAIQRFAMARSAGLTVRRGTETKTIVAPGEGELPIALYVAGADISEPLTLKAFETIVLRMGDEYLSALALFSSPSLREAFLMQFSPAPPGTDLVLPVDLALPIAGRNIHEPHSHGGFIVRWLGPGRTASLILPNPVLQRGWRVGGLSVEMTMITHLEPVQAGLLRLSAAGEPLNVTLLQEGRTLRLLAQLPETVLAEETVTLALQAPAALCIFPEALKGTARALTFGLTSLSFHLRAQGEDTAETLDAPAAAPMDPAAALARFADAHRKSRAEILVAGERVIYEPPRRTEDGGLVAVNTLAGRFLFCRIATGSAENDPVAYRVSDLLGEDDSTGVLDPDAPDPALPHEAVLVRLLPFFHATSAAGATGTADATGNADVTGNAGTQE